MSAPCPPCSSLPPRIGIFPPRKPQIEAGLAVLKMAAITCSSRAAAPSEWGPLHPTLLLEGHPQPPLLPASPQFLPDSGTAQLLLLLSSARQTSSWRSRSCHPCPPPPAPRPSGTVPCALAKSKLVPFGLRQPRAGMLEAVPKPRILADGRGAINKSCQLLSLLSVPRRGWFGERGGGGEFREAGGNLFLSSIS